MLPAVAYPTHDEVAPQSAIGDDCQNDQLVPDLRANKQRNYAQSLRHIPQEDNFKLPITSK